MKQNVIIIIFKIIIIYATLCVLHKRGCGAFELAFPAWWTCSLRIFSDEKKFQKDSSSDSKDWLPAQEWKPLRISKKNWERILNSEARLEENFDEWQYYKKPSIKGRLETGNHWKKIKILLGMELEQTGFGTPGVRTSIVIHPTEKASEMSGSTDSQRSNK